MRGRVLRQALAVITVSVLAACGGPAAVEKDTFYRLSPPSLTSPAGQSVRYAGVADVRPFLADGVLSQRAIAYRSEAQESVVQQYSYHFWADPPPVALQQALVQTLRSSGLFKMVVDPSLRVTTDYDVQGRVVQLEHIRSEQATPAQAAVTMELSLVQKRGNALLLQKTYQRHVDAADGSVAAMRDAAAAAVEAIFADFLRDLSNRPL